MPQKEWPKFVNLYTKLAIYYAFHTKMALIPGGIRAYINGIWRVVYVIKEEVRGESWQPNTRECAHALCGTAISDSSSIADFTDKLSAYSSLPNA